MSDVIIRAEGLGKRYIINRQADRERYTALRDIIARKGQNVMGTLRGERKERASRVEDFWALKDLNFEIKRGDVVGIIGRNGAGKSTLLKILSRITEPSAGRVTIKGRVASLLEVGTGFHPELTGRENVYLNGAILGMTRSEINRKFDEIVDFSGVEKFLDTPVKRYSSGMYVRLAFAVAAHLEPEILVVDEVLAVGDMKFQKKSQQKLKEVSLSGRTVLFVSHNLAAVSALCSTGLLLRGGKAVARGPVLNVLMDYSRVDAPSSSFQRDANPSRTLNLLAGKASYDMAADGISGNIMLELTLLAKEDMMASIDLRIKDALGSPVGFATIGAFRPDQLIRLVKGTQKVTVRIPAGALANGEYSISIDLTDPLVQMFDQVEDILTLEVDAASSESALRTLEQGWGYGSTLLPMELVDISITGSAS